jgi:hypothetical protein
MLLLFCVSFACILLSLHLSRRHPHKWGKPFDRKQLIAFAVGVLGAAIAVLNFVLTVFG